MKPMVKCYLRYFLLYFKTLHEYKLNWFISLVKIPIILGLYWFVWKTLFQYRTSPIGPYNFKEIILYLLAVQWIALACSYNVSEKIATDIRTGQLSIYLARPVSYLPAQFANFMAHVFFSMVITIIPFLTAVYLLRGSPITPLQYLQFLFSILTASGIYFLLECCFGTTSFWLYKIFGLHFFMTTAFNIMGGKLIPLELFPDWLQKISYFSPLRAIYFDPINILMGQSSSPVFLLQFAWLLFLSVLVAWLWREGQIVYEASG